MVEDEQDVSELLRYNPSVEGYEVLTAPDGAEAVKTARPATPDVILLDVMLPFPAVWAGLPPRCRTCTAVDGEREVRAGLPTIVLTACCARPRVGVDLQAWPKRSSSWRPATRPTTVLFSEGWR